MSHLEVRHLRLIIAISEEGSVTKASHRLHLTQSALSHQLRDIESQLGTKLFARGKKKMLLTPAGEALITPSRRILRDLKQMEDDVRETSAGRVGKIRLSTECYTCYHWLPQALMRFRGEFPQVGIEIDVAATRRPVEALFNDRIDVAIVSRPLRDKRLHVRPLFEDELVVVMKHGHPLAQRRFIRAIDFAGESLLTYSAPKEDLDVFHHVLTPAAVTPKEVLPIALTEAIIEMVKAGIGITVLPRWSVASQLKAKMLTALPLTSKGMRRRWSAVTLKTNMLPDCTLAFIQLLTLQSASIFKQLEKESRLQVA